MHQTVHLRGTVEESPQLANTYFSVLRQGSAGRNSYLGKPADQLPPNWLGQMHLKPLVRPSSLLPPRLDAPAKLTRCLPETVSWVPTQRGSEPQHLLVGASVVWLHSGMKRAQFWIGLWLLALGGMLMCGCTTVPVTGRTQFNFLSPQQEMELGLTAFNQMKKEVPISKDPQLNALVTKVGKRIAAVAQADLPGAQWEFVVFESKEANAFCLPGGKVGVYTGILPITKDEEGLAVVLAHEVAHAAARHGGERMSQAIVLHGLGEQVGAFSARDPRWQAVANTAYGIGSQLLVALPHSRLTESEADHIGLIYMARAGYNPEAAIAFWERFAEYNRKAGGATPWWLRTHPLDEKRIERLRAWMPEAKAQYRPAQ
jgi:Zn-dependent protease with chaperone function